MTSVSALGTPVRSRASVRYPQGGHRTGTPPGRGAGAAPPPPAVGVPYVSTLSTAISRRPRSPDHRSRDRPESRPPESRPPESRPPESPVSRDVPAGSLVSSGELEALPGSGPTPGSDPSVSVPPIPSRSIPSRSTRTRPARIRPVRTGRIRSPPARTRTCSVGAGGGGWPALPAPARPRGHRAASGAARPVRPRRFWPGPRTG